MLRVLLAVFVAMAAGIAAAVELTDAQRQLLSQADIVLLGEVHDNAAHHAGQGAVLRQLAPTAVVFEMMTPEMAAVFADGDRGDLAALDARIGWSAAGWPPMTLYAPVFVALGDAGVRGAALPRERVCAAFAEGAAAVFGAGAGRFGLDRPLPEAEAQTRQDAQFDAHCRAMPREMMGGMVEAQRLRDAWFSNVALTALRESGGPVVVIAGHGHARRDWGMPALIAKAAPDIRVVSVGYLEEPAAADDPRFDIGFVTPAAERENPCAAFDR